MNKRIGAAVLTAMLAVSLIPATVFAYTGGDDSSSETGVIVREIPAEEVTETEEAGEASGTSTTGTTGSGTSGQSGDIRNEDGSVTQSGSTIDRSGSSSGTAGIGSIDDLPESVQDAIQYAEKRTGMYKNHVMSVCIAYGGRQEIEVAALRGKE